MQSIDRLAELQAEVEVKEEKQESQTKLKNKKGIPLPPSSSSDDVTKAMNRYESVKKCIESIDANSATVHRLRKRNKNATTDKARNEAVKQIEEVSSSTKSQASSIADVLSKLHAENSTLPDSATKNINTNLFDQHIRLFRASLSSFHSSISEFQNDLRARSRREILSVNPCLPPEEIEKIVDEGKAQQMVMQVLTGEQVKQVLQNVEERHLEILKLEKQIRELFELWKDLSILVDVQSESLNIIENRIGNASQYTNQAEIQLNKAEDYQSKARKKRNCLLMALLGVLGCAAIPVAIKTA